MNANLPPFFCLIRSLRGEHREHTNKTLVSTSDNKDDTTFVITNDDEDHKDAKPLKSTTNNKDDDMFVITNDNDKAKTRRKTGPNADDCKDDNTLASASTATNTNEPSRRQGAA